MFEGAESRTMFSWLPFDQIDDANLFPPFLGEYVKDVPQIPKYVVHSDLELPLA